MKITIATTTGGRKWEFDVQPLDTIMEIKKMFCDETGICEDQQLLTYCGRKLENDKTLADYNIQRDSIIGFAFSLIGCGG